MAALLGPACGSEGAPWTAFPSFDVDAAAIDFGSLRPPNTGARPNGSDMAGAGTAAPNAIDTGAPEDRDAAPSDASAASAAASDAEGGDASDVADSGTAGSAGARTDDGRRRGPFGGWDGGGRFGRGETSFAGRSGGEDRADAGGDAAVDPPTGEATGVDASPTAPASDSGADADDAGAL